MGLFLEEGYYIIYEWLNNPRRTFYDLTSTYFEGRGPGLCLGMVTVGMKTAEFPVLVGLVMIEGCPSPITCLPVTYVIARRWRK